jgi:hypothetical protein
VVVQDDMGSRLVFHGDHAKKLRDKYDEELKTRAGKFHMRVDISVDFEEPTGRMDR